MTYERQGAISTSGPLNVSTRHLDPPHFRERWQPGLVTVENGNISIQLSRRSQQLPCISHTLHPSTIRVLTGRLIPPWFNVCAPLPDLAESDHKLILYLSLWARDSFIKMLQDESIEVEEVKGLLRPPNWVS